MGFENIGINDEWVLATFFMCDDYRRHGDGKYDMTIGTPHFFGVVTRKEKNCLFFSEK